MATQLPADKEYIKIFFSSGRYKLIPRYCGDTDVLELLRYKVDNECSGNPWFGKASNRINLKQMEEFVLIKRKYKKEDKSEYDDTEQSEFAEVPVTSKCDYK